MRGLDIRTPQLSIQAKIIFVDRTDIEELGIKYDLGNQNQFFNKLVQRCCDPTDRRAVTSRTSTWSTSAATRCPAIGNADASHHRLGARPGLLHGASAASRLTTFLSALERTDLADIQAEPVITTLDNRQADILVGEETPVRVIDAGRRQRCTPRPTCSSRRPVSGSRSRRTSPTTARSLMELHTERSAIQPLAAADLGFVFQTQRADNQLLVNDGETAVIGGLTVTAGDQHRSGHPAAVRAADHRQAVQLQQERGEPA